jgi:hypothetical protein
MNRLVALLLAIVPIAAVAQEAAGGAAPAAPLRDGVYLGVGLGTAGLFSPDQALRAYRIRLGMTRSPRLQFGIEVQHAEDGGTQFDFTDVSATFYPWRTTFFVRGGFGFSSILRTHYGYGLGAALPETTGGSGINLLAGLGAQLGRSNGVNFTVNVEAQVHYLKSVLSDSHEEDTTLSAWLGLEWH